MFKIGRMVLIGMLFNVLLLFVQVQPLAPGECEDGIGKQVATVMPVRQGEAGTLAGHKSGTLPCPVGRPLAATPAATLTATRMLMPTVTLTGSVDGTIIPPMATVRHTAKIVDADTATMPKLEDGSVIYALLRQLGQVLMGLPLRGVMVPLPLFDLRIGWQWLMWLIQEWLG